MPRETGVRLYKERRLIENQNGILKYLRGVFSRFDKTAKKH